MESLLDPQLWVSFLTLTALEIVLGVDNLVFIAILADRLPVEQREQGRRVGLALALVSRLLLLSMLFVISQLTSPVLTLFGQSFSWRDLILLGGGLFLLYKATTEIHEMTAIPADSERESPQKVASFFAVVSQIAVVDIIFSLDSVITAVGMADNPGAMVASGVTAVPSSFEIDGEQYIAVQAGWGIDAQRMQSGIDALDAQVTMVPQGGTVMVFKLGK